MYAPCLVVMLAVGSSCAPTPADDPVRVDLPVYDQPQAASDLELAQPLLPENHAGVGSRSDNSLIGNIISHKIQAATSVLGSKLNHVSHLFVCKHTNEDEVGGKI